MLSQESKMGSVHVSVLILIILVFFGIILTFSGMGFWLYAREFNDAIANWLYASSYNLVVWAQVPIAIYSLVSLSLLIQRRRIYSGERIRFLTLGISLLIILIVSAASLFGFASAFVGAPGLVSIVHVLAFGVFNYVIPAGARRFLSGGTSEI